ncbi:MAG: MATE family efflux transporter [Moritella sp.]|uniref:MATE family efflux transporter n=1 Tax=Moritella sp. TaxID=78556 RepID=UPI0029AF478F|nr:MATE family efflux transporter [Moritella sp.]MDX2322616.1 MATE family efflux transporter [Moritella sp.]
MTVKNYTNLSRNAIADGMLSKMFKLGFPVAIQSALAAILALADVLMVSDFGIESTAAVGTASKWHFVAIMIMAGMASANGVLVAQYWGKQDRRAAKTITLLAMQCGVKILLPVTLVITLFSGYIMLLQTTDAKVIELGSTYLWYSFPVLLLTHLVMICESALRSSGDTVTPLYLSGFTIIVNIGLNFWLINGGLGIPAMGVAGAALATTISRLLQVALMFGFLHWRKHWLLSAPIQTDSSRLWAAYKYIAIPSTASAVLWAIGMLSYQMIFGHMGTTELAVFSLLGPFESLCYSVFFGISVACSVLLGQALGRDEFTEAFTMSKFFIKTVLAFGLAIGLLLLLGKDIILSWLNLGSDELYPLASPALVVLCCAIWLRMLNMIIINGILRAGGDNHFCLRMDLIAMWIIGVPSTAFAALVLDWDFNHVYMLLLVEEIVKLSLCFHRYLSGRWLNNLTIAAH